MAKFRRKKGPLPPKTVFLLSFIIFIIFTFQGLWLLNKGIEPNILSWAKTKSEQIALVAVNDAVSKKIASQLDIKKLIVLHHQEGTDKVSYSFDPKEYNNILSQATRRIQRHLDLLQEGNMYELENLNLPDDIEIVRDENEVRKEQGVIYWVPLGVATRNALLSNLGPQVPVRVQFIGNVATEIRTEVKTLGINSYYLELYIDIGMTLNVIIPSQSEDIVVNNAIKIGDLFIEGEVPQFYNNGGGGMDPSFIPGG